jgi:hypothetical protein
MADTYPSYGGPDAARKPSPRQAGTATPADPTNEPGQYPVGGWGDAIFGGALPQGTGAPGTAGGRGSGSDATVEPGQLSDGLTGVSDADISNTGAPGSLGSQPGNSGSSAVDFTRPTAGVTTYGSETVHDEITGPKDWTQANDDGYGTGGPQLPGLAGNEPQAGEGRFQPGGGRVMRGGRMNGQG